MKFFVRILMLTALLGSVVGAWGQSQLPACPATGFKENCYGTETYSNGPVYTGEFRGGVANGFGSMYYGSGRIPHVGFFKDGIYQAGVSASLPKAAASNHTKAESQNSQARGDKTAPISGLSEIKRVNQLPNCARLSALDWTNCFGTVTFESNKEKYVGEFQSGKYNGRGSYSFADGTTYVGEFRGGGRFGEGALYDQNGMILRAGVWDNGTLVQAPQVAVAQPATDPTLMQLRAEVEQAKQKQAEAEDRQRKTALTAVSRQQELDMVSRQLAEDRRKLNEERTQRAQASPAARINIQATAAQPDVNGEFVITVQTSADTASFMVDGEEQGGRKDGAYQVRRVARVGQPSTYTLQAKDVYGNTDSKTLTVSRQAATARPVLAQLNPANLRVQAKRDAVAIIIGIQDYKRVPKAEFANDDARVFYDYAVRGLGVRPENINMLIDAEAEDVEIIRAFENWLPVHVNKNQTDVYVFFSGHGLPSPDGRALYLLPHGVDKQLLARTAVAQKELVAALQAAKPKSVTMFIDSCYSGQTRGGEVLLAGVRPLVLKADEQAFPASFTVISAAANDQLSSASPELKHGIFSYYLMKGMEGEADENRDGQITLGEMQAYLADKVSRQAMGMNRKQEPQFVGDPSRVLLLR